MTIQEKERLAVLETKVDDMRRDMGDIKDSVKNIEFMMGKQDEKFITKKSIVTWISVATGVIIAVVAVANYLGHKV